MKISLNPLSMKSIEEAKKELIKYRNSLPVKCQQIVNQLATEGLETAKVNVGSFGKYITFTIQLNSLKDGYKAILIAKDSQKIVSRWQTKTGMREEEVSPLLMAEFGSGFKAQNPNDIEGVGQGTFPNQTHAFDKEGWYWIDENGDLKHSYGISPTMPMYKASKTIEDRCISIAREVFNE